MKTLLVREINSILEKQSIQTFRYNFAISNSDLSVELLYRKRWENGNVDEYQYPEALDLNFDNNFLISSLMGEPSFMYFGRLEDQSVETLKTIRDRLYLLLAGMKSFPDGALHKFENLSKLIVMSQTKTFKLVLLYLRVSNRLKGIYKWITKSF